MIFEEWDEPTWNYCHNEWGFAMLQMTVPGHRDEDMGHDEQARSLHAV